MCSPLVWHEFWNKMNLKKASLWHTSWAECSPLSSPLNMTWILKENALKKIFETSPIDRQTFRFQYRDTK